MLVLVLAIEPLLGQVEQIEYQIQSLEAIDNNFNIMLTGLSEGLEKADADLKEVIDLLPATINLLNVNFGGDTVFIAGVASSEYDIFGYARALRSSERFNEVTILSIREVYTQEHEVEVRLFEFDFLIK